MLKLCIKVVRMFVATGGTMSQCFNSRSLFCEHICTQMHMDIDGTFLKSRLQILYLSTCSLCYFILPFLFIYLTAVVTSYCNN